MKKTYEKPEMEVIRFSCEDIITTSSSIPLDSHETPIEPLQ